MQSPHTTHDLPPEDINLVATWLVADRVRWIAGAVAGLFAGVVALAVAGVVSAASGMEFLYPAKLMATWPLGWGATESGVGFGAVIVGFLVWEAIAAFWGFVYGHFVKTSSLGGLLAMGVVWGFFSWVFEWNLFFHSIKPILYSGVGPGVALLVCMVYGVSMTSISFFDRVFR